MSDQQHQFTAQGVRAINVQLARGDVRIERIDGEMIIVRAESAMQIEQLGDRLEIRPAHGMNTPGTRRRPRTHVKI